MRQTWKSFRNAPLVERPKPTSHGMPDFTPPTLQQEIAAMTAESTLEPQDIEQDPPGAQFVFPEQLFMGPSMC